MDVEQFREDVRQGRVGVDRLLDLVVTLQQQLQAAQQRVAELEQKLGPSTPKLDQPFSVREEERRQQARGQRRRSRKGPRRHGRVRTAEKVARAVRTEPVYPEGVAPEDCRLSHTRPVWRLEGGRAVLVAYEVYRGPRNRYGQVPGVLGRSEFGIEIVVAVAFQVYVVGLSFDKVCLLLGFFQSLPLRKSQADALLSQLGRHWEGEFERLCTLLANSAVVHADETGWSIRSVWAFLSEQARVFLFGVHKDAATLAQVLDPATFQGVLVSDDAAVYANFTRAQKCWAHLLRKAIRLTLLEPENAGYRRFADQLLAIYRRACRVPCDRRLGAAGRARKVGLLEDEVLDLCLATWAAELPPLEGPLNDYRLLCNELMRLFLNEELFTFVTAAPARTPAGETVPVPGTNNESERALRGSAEARKVGRTSKTLRGARRRTVVVSVLESLRQYLAKFTLSGVVDEVSRWSDRGRSCFAELLAKLRLPPPAASPPPEPLLDRLLPVSSG
jgi:hypothetical protein